MRKKSVMALDSRYVTQIENAYYHVNPPEVVTITQKERPVMHQFIRKLLYQDLQKNNTDKIMRLMRKLDWTNAGVLAYAIKCLTGAHNLKYFNIRLVNKKTIFKSHVLLMSLMFIFDCLSFYYSII